MKHFNVHFLPDDLTAVIHEGASLLEAAAQAGIILNTPCGAAGRCGKCKVILMPAKKEVQACEYLVHHDLEVVVPQTSRFFRQRILEHGIHHKAALDPSVKKLHLEGPIADPDAFCSRLSSILGEGIHLENSANGLLERQEVLKSQSVTAVLTHRNTDAAPPEQTRWCLSGVEPGDTRGKLYGLAVDVGTTTVVARLLDLNTGREAATVSCGNPQARYGADVISRITHSEKDNGLTELHHSIIACLNELIEQACAQAAIQKEDIYELAAVGNTTMNHLLLNYPVAQLGQAPYRPHSLLAANRSPQDFELAMNTAGNLYTPANIAGFIGSDTLAAALACQMDAAEEGTLLVDIGTNGELVLSANKRMLAASCAAGPALEGAGIACGSRAQAGAIERVLVQDNRIDVDVIGGTEPVSICGSGLIDATAVMLTLGIIDFSGRFTEPQELDALSGKLKNRLIEINGMPAFVLAGEFDGKNWNNPVYLTQKDIRQVQLAKAAIHAGIQLLLKDNGLQTTAIKKLLLAGAFGNYIQKESAVRIGLLPNIQIDRIHFVGNAAGTGAEMILLSRPARNKAAELSRQIQYLEIAHQSEFQTVFSDSLLFPEK
ncbi:MAG: ASKHA domain-containing protein [Planctomycetaceae bacterium]|nr:ASKHA domain-containing protein [Planctomycetaceae bacterium]